MDKIDWKRSFFFFQILHEINGRNWWMEQWIEHNWTAMSELIKLPEKLIELNFNSMSMFTTI